MTEITATLVKILRDKTGLAMMKCKQALQSTNGNIEEAIDLLRKEGVAIAAKKVDRTANEGHIAMLSTSNIAIIANISCETDFVAASDDFKVFSSKVVSALVEQQPKDIDALLQSTIDGTTVQDLQNQVIAKLGENISVKKIIIETIDENEWVQNYSHMNGKIGALVKLSSTPKSDNQAVKDSLAKDIAMQVAATQPIAINIDGIPSEILEKEKEIYKEQVITEGKPSKFADKIIEGRVKKFEKEVCLNQQIFIKDSKVSIQQLLKKMSEELKVKSIQIESFQRLQLGE